MLDKITPLEKAIELIDAGNNIFITGGGGVGKSYILRKLKEHYDKYYKDDKKFQITSTTGVSAFNIGGQTIHSFAGIFHKKIYVNYPDTKRKLTKNLKECKILAIDEISMLDKVTLDSLNNAFKEITGLWNKPFGGIQMVFIGDFFQLPPVPDNNNRFSKYKKMDKVEYCFNSYAWEAGNFITLNLQEVKRQSDKNFISALNKIRTGNITQEVTNLFKEREENHSIETNHKILYLFSRTEKMDKHNNNMLSEDENCSGKIKTYTANDYYCKLVDDKKVIEDEIPSAGSKNDKYKEPKSKLNLECRYSEEINLRNGCRVMLLKNLDLEKGLVNGSCGIVKSHSENGVVVKFDKIDEEITIKKETFSFQYRYMEDEKTKKVTKEIAKRIQFPLQLAYAITIHKAQGMTFDELVIDLDNIFSEGMSYVALSRNRTLENLYIKHFKPKEIKTSKEVIDFYANLKNCITFTEDGDMIENFGQTADEKPQNRQNLQKANESIYGETQYENVDETNAEYSENNSDNTVPYNNQDENEYFEDIGCNRAIIECTQKINSDPMNASNFNTRAEAYYGNKEYENAVKDWNNVLKLDSEFEIKYFDKACAEYKLGQYPEAIDDYTKYLDDNYEDALAYYYRGHAKEYSLDYNYKDVIEDYSLAIEYEPDNTAYLNDRAKAYYLVNDYENAVDDWNEILEINSEYKIDYFDKANAEYKIEQYENALESIEKYLDYNPKDEDAENLKNWLNKKLEPDNNKKLIAEYLENAEAYYENEEYENAVNEWNKILEVDPEYEINYFDKAYAEDEIELYSEAIDDYTKYLKNSPNSAAAYNNRGWAKECSQDYSIKDAIEDYSIAIKLEPEKAKYINNRAKAYYNNEKYEKAIDDWNKVLDLDPYYKINYYYKADAEYKIDQYEEAIEDYTRYLEHNPNDADAYNGRAEAHYCANNDEKAINDWNKVFEIDSKYSIYYYGKADAEYNINLLDDAIISVEKYLNKHPEDEDAQKLKDLINNKLQQKNNENILSEYLENAESYYENEEYEKAVNEWNKILELNPDYEIDYFDKAYSEYCIEKYSEAIEDYTKYLSNNPKDAGAFNDRGSCKFCLRDYIGAIQDLLSAVKFDPDNCLYIGNCAEAYYANKEYEKAVKKWNKVLNLDSTHSINYFNKAYAEYKVGLYPESILSVDKCLKEEPNNKDAKDLKNMINIIILKDKNEKLISKYIKKAKDSIENNYYEDAKKYCEEIIKLDENNAYAHLYLGVCYYYNNDYYMAEEEYKKAIDIDNKFGKAYANIGFIMHNKGKYESAIKYFEIAKKHDPSVMTCIEDSKDMLRNRDDFDFED